ncbi:Glutathione S-transferase 1 [Eumeta japonica]|uniref:Glutathione S-transferase 1 n=1 Tax=Eumeta variegata TaxID=151549 RepID=A0A4C1TX10_EUMVA|nr:Glutathione S-transferase 1 [Eumeta japonica]
MTLKLYKSDTDPGSQAAMMMINPKQTVTVLVDGDTILTDSHKICCHLNAHHGYDDDMYPREPCLRRLVHEKLDFERTVLSSALHDAVVPKTKVWWDYLTTRNFYPICQHGVQKFSDLLNSILTKDPEVAMKLCKNNMSPPSLAVVMTIQALGIKDVDYIDVDLSKDENLTEEFKKSVELACFLTMVYCACSCRSHAIAGYFISAYGSDESWYPRDPERRAVIDQRLHFNSGVLLPAFLEAEIPICIGSATSYDSKHLAKISNAYDVLETFLRKKWIAGDDLSIADLTCASTTCFLDVIVPVDSEKCIKFFFCMPIELNVLLANYVTVCSWNLLQLDTVNVIFGYLHCRQDNGSYLLNPITENDMYHVIFCYLLNY